MSQLIIDTDTHFTEPPDLWTNRMPKKWGDDVLHSEWSDRDHAEVWVAGGRVIGRVWGFLAYGNPRANAENERPARRSDAHPATWDQAERVKVMDAQGIRTAVLYPNIAGLQPKQFLSIGSTELATAHAQVYNDFQLDWANNYPGRFVPMAVVPFWDIAAAVAEVERNVGRGFGGIVMTAAPHVHDQPFLADAHWDPLWRACVEAGMSVSFHIANGAPTAFTSPEFERLMEPATHLGYTAVPTMIANGTQMVDLLHCGVLVRHPELRFVSVESGLGWVPFVLEASDYHFKRAKGDTAHRWGDLLPSDLFRRQVYVNYWFEQLEPWHIEAIGEDNILFETDFPHRTCLEGPDVEHAINVGMAQLPERVRQKILWENAARLYHLDVVPGAGAD